MHFIGLGLELRSNACTHPMHGTSRQCVLPFIRGEALLILKGVLLSSRLVLLNNWIFSKCVKEVNFVSSKSKNDIQLQKVQTTYKSSMPMKNIRNQSKKGGT